MVANQRILFSEVWDGVEHRANTKIRWVKVQNDIHPSKHIYKLVVCLSTNGERALNYTIVIQTTKIKSSC